MIRVTDPIVTLPGIGPTIAKKLTSGLSVESLFDLLYHIPFRYEDRSLKESIRHARIGDTVSLRGEISEIKNQFTKKGRFIQMAELADSSGSIQILWFNQSYLAKTLKKGTPVVLFGKIDFYKQKPALISPDYEIDDGHELLHTGRIVPIYPETRGITSKFIRTKLHWLLNNLPFTDFLSHSPAEFPNWSEALWNLHFPKDLSKVDLSRNRLAFDEFLIAATTAKLRKAEWQKTKLTHSLKVDSEKIADFISHLPFTLTPDQSKAVSEISHDLAQQVPMNRLLEGDVGSGKTVVAAIAAFIAYKNGYQSLLLAPTQILAQQHFATLSKLFLQEGIPVQIATSQTKLDSTDTTGVFVGTHSLISKNYLFPKVGLIVIDEQHRFGVAQRALSIQKGSSPHVLTMTATPIPRTIALTLHGDLELSVLSNPPTGRLKIKTWLVPEVKRQSAYSWIESQIVSQHTQAFIVCPFIETSESTSSVKAATVEFEKLKMVFPNLKLGLLHGKQKPKDKDEVISKFRSGEVDILISTPVVEVGIDIPNSSIMVIEGADRFGLAQLHQLRGRVGRADAQSYCLLFADKDSERLKALESHHSGLELAEIDLKIRGPGQLYGTSQHGSTEFRVASFANPDLITKAKLLSDELVNNLEQEPLLRSLLDPGKITIVQPN